jgi:serine protease Do
MTRTREWTQFGFLVVVTILLAIGFAAAVDFPRITQAQERTSALTLSQRPDIPAARPAAELGDAFAAVAETVRPAVVYIQAEGPQATTNSGNPIDDFFNRPDGQIRRGSGSGFIISAEGHIITNNHVVEDANRITVRLLDRRSFDARVVGRDPLTDIAVLKIDADNLRPAALGTSEDIRIGEWALAVGNPLGEAFSFTVTAGIISGRGRRLDGLRRGQANYTIHDFIQTDAAINPGNSGGPLVNIRGEVIGVNAAIASQTGLYTGYSFAVPIDLARVVSDQLIRDGYVTRAVLGITIDDADALDAEYVSLDSTYGVKVQDFSVGSAAERAGLEVGDIIIAVNSDPALYTAQLQTKIGFMKPGEHVAVTVARRGGERRTYDVELQQANELRPQQTLGRDDEPRPGTTLSINDKIGVAVEVYSPNELVREFGIDQRMADQLAGLRVVRVDPRGPSADGRLQEGVFITHINAQRVRSEAEFLDALNAVRSGEVFSVRFAFPFDGAVQNRTVRIRAAAR